MDKGISRMQASVKTMDRPGLLALAMTGGNGNGILWDYRGMMVPDLPNSYSAARRSSSR